MAKSEGQYQLSVCIPNYNRIGMLERLLEEICGQIVGSSLEREVEICVSDDCSETDPWDTMEEVRSKFPDVSIAYTSNEKNMGMDYNFLNCVRVAHGKYAWIVGNDDVPVEDALGKILEILDRGRNQDIDIIVTPFDSFDYDGNFVGTVHPLGSDMKGDMLLDTVHKDQLHRLAMVASDNSALFGFLSNVVFKRECWIQHGDMFADKMSSIFIQVYMNLQTLKDGARYLYTPQKIVRNYLDDGTNQTVDRTYRIAAGLYDAMDFFFEGEERAHIEKQVVDIFMASVFMEFPETDARKRKVDSFISEKMDMLREYYIRKDARAEYFRERPVIIYGAGRFGKMALEDLVQYGTNVIGFCDADASKQGGSIKGKLIFDFERLMKEYFRHRNCTIVVANNRHLVPIIQNLLCHQVLRIAVIT